MKTKKTPDQIASIIDEMYGEDAIGGDLYNVTTNAILAGGYTQDEVQEIRRSVVSRLLELRSLRRAS